MNKKLLILPFLFLVASLSAKTVYLKPNEASVAWADVDQKLVYTSINKAMAGSGNGDEIWMAAGVYDIAEKTVLKQGVSIYGGFIGTETAIGDRRKVENGKPWEFVNETILQKSAEVEATNHFNFFEQTAQGNTKTIIDGLIMQNNTKAVISIRNGTIIQNCVSRNNVDSSTNTNSSRGCGFTLYNGGTLKDSYVLNNVSSLGAGVYTSNYNATNMMYVENVTFEGNVAATGWSGLGGGAIYAKDHAMVSGCVFYNNKVTDGNGGYGKGAAIASYSNSNTFINCLVYNNEGADVFYMSGGMLVNCTIVNNTQSSEAVYLAGNNQSKMLNCVIWGNDLKKNPFVCDPNKPEGTYTIANVAYDTPLTTALPDGVANENLFILEMENTGTDATKNYIKHVSPVSFKGGSTTDEQLTTLRKANWQVDGGSYIINKGSGDCYYEVVDAPLFDVLGNERFQNENIDLGAFETKSGPVGIKSPATDVEDGIELFVRNNQIVVIGNLQGAVNIYDTIGRLISSKVVQSTETVIPVAKSGLYLVQVKTNKNIISKKIILNF